MAKMPGIHQSQSANPDNPPIPTIKQAAAALQRIREKCGAKAAGLDSLSKLLNDPLFQQLLSLENALTKVKHEISANPDDFPDHTLSKYPYVC